MKALHMIICVIVHKNYNAVMKRLRYLNQFDRLVGSMVRMLHKSKNHNQDSYLEDGNWREIPPPPTGVESKSPPFIFSHQPNRVSCAVNSCM